jgi:hypothetical protein
MNTEQFNSTEIKEVYEIFAKNIQPSISSFYQNSSKEHLHYLNLLESCFLSFAKNQEEAKNKPDEIKQHNIFRSELLEILSKHSLELNQQVFVNFYEQFSELAFNKLNGLHRLINIREPFEGYPLSLTDNPMVTFQKIGSNSIRHAKLTGKRIANIFRKIFRRKCVEVVVYRNRRVLFRSMAQEFLVNQFIEKSLPLVTLFMENRNKGFLTIWQLGDSIDTEFQQKQVSEKAAKITNSQEITDWSEIFNKITLEQQEVAQQIAKQIEHISNEVFKNFENTFRKADTPDLPRTAFGSKPFEKRKKQVANDTQNLLKNWENTTGALFDDWSIDVEISHLYYAVFDRLNCFMEKFDTYLIKNFETSKEQIRAFIDERKKVIETNITTKKESVSVLEKERKNVEKQLIDNILTPTIEQLTGCFTGDFNNLWDNILEQANRISEKRTFIKGMNYLVSVSESQVKQISPRELLNFEALSVFKSRLTAIEVRTDAQLEKVRINLLGLGTVCDFTLESAQIMLEQKGITAKNISQTVFEGFDRTLVRLDKAAEIVAEIQSSLKTELYTAIQEFNDDINKLKNTDTILELNLKIAKIKAIERTLEIKRQIKTYILELIPKIKNGWHSGRSHVTEKINGLKIRIGLTVQKKYLSFELSEFINQTQESLKKLPFVYQRLYQLNPTNEERFFVNREAELAMLERSHKNWLKDRFITVAVIGDKGSGITSAISYFVSKTEIKADVVKQTLSNKIYTKESYFAFFSNIFEADKFETNQQIIEFVNQLEGTKVVILENMQHMFLKKVNGFDCVNMFFELMAHTMKKILWICAYTSHSWNYLEKTVHISNYFTNEIYMQPMGQEVIEEIIYKRNRLSGYQIQFLSSEFHEKDKKFAKLNNRDKQKVLRKEFFKTLYRVSSGNISLAQLYWLQSTRVASDEVIEISTISEFDFTFIKNLTGNELFALQALILHDGLELDDFSNVMGNSLAESRNLLTPMLEKGLLIKPRNKYNINPIIFKHITNYLISKNFIN